MGHKMLIVLFLFFLLTEAHLFGQQPDTLSLQEIQVNEKRITRPQGGIPVQSLEAIQLQRIAGNSVADALRHFAGVNVKDYGGIGGLKTVQVRSLGAQHTGVFVDGVPMSDAATGQIDLSRLLIDLSQDLSLTSGGAVDLFRPARWFGLASALSLQTISPGFGHQSVKVRAGLRAGSFGLFQPFAHVDLKTSQNSRAQLATRYLKADGIYPFRITNGSQPGEWMQRHNSDVENFGLHAKLVLRLPHATLDYGALFDHSKRGLPGAVTLYNPRASQRIANTDLNQHLRWASSRGKSQHQLLVRHALMQLHYLDPDFLNQQGRLEQFYNQQEFYVSQLWGLSSGNFRFTASNDFTLNTLNTDHLPLNPCRLSWHQLIAAGWQNVRWETTTHLLWMHAAELKTTAQSGKQYHPLSPGLSVAWRTSQNSSSKIRFMMKRSFRLPSFNELFYNIVGNPSLVPERATMANLGWVGSTVWRQTELHWQLDAFHSRLHDKIIAIPTKNLFVWSMRNIGYVVTTGMEAGLNTSTTLNKKLLLVQHLNYTLQIATDRSSAASPSYGHQLQYLPVHTLNWFAQLSAGNFWAGLGLYANSHRFYLPENIAPNRLPPWYTADISLGYETKGLSIPVTIKAEASNLFNHQYEIIRSFPMPGRALMLTLTANSP
jgi:outer membrane receptor protein involved in Fe transport